MKVHFPDTWDEDEQEDPNGPVPAALHQLLKQGDTISRYQVEACIGDGGVASVYRVRHTVLDSTHALKVLKVPRADLLQRLLAEGRLQATLEHPNIVTVRDVFEVHGAPALLMDYVDGPSLASFLQQHGKLTPELCTNLFLDVLHAMCAAHELGVIHRDLKPGNILLEANQEEDDGPSNWRARVSDFGIAKHFQATRLTSAYTSPGSLLGTPAYMAPEQFVNPSSADERADIFALGVILFEMCSGVHPFASTDASSDKTRSAPSKRLETLIPDVPKPLILAVDAALAIDIENRVPDVPTLLSIVRGELTPPYAWQTNQQPEEPMQTGISWLPWGLALVCCLGLIVSLAVLWQAKDEHEASRRTSRQQVERVEQEIRASKLSSLAFQHARSSPAKAYAFAQTALSSSGEEGTYVEQALVAELLSKGARSKVLKTPGQVLTVAAYGSKVAAGLDNDTIMSWDRTTGEVLFSIPAGFHSRVTDLSYVLDGKLLVASPPQSIRVPNHPTPVRVFDAKTGVLRHTINHGARTRSVFISPDGTWCATTGRDDFVRIWDLETGEPLQKFSPGGFMGANCVAISADSTLLASSAMDAEHMYVWDVKKPDVAPRKLLNPATRVRRCNMSFSPRGDALVMTWGKGVVRWDVATGDLVTEKRRTSGLLIAHSPDGERLLEFDEKYGARLLNAKTLETISLLKGHHSRIMDAMFSPDGQFVATISTDAALGLWQVEDGELFSKWYGHESWGLALATFSEASSWGLVSGGREKTVRVWEAPQRLSTSQLSSWPEHPLARSRSVGKERFAVGTREGNIHAWKKGSLFAKWREKNLVFSTSWLFQQDAMLVGTPKKVHLFTLDGDENSASLEATFTMDVDPRWIQVYEQDRAAIAGNGSGVWRLDLSTKKAVRYNEPGKIVHARFGRHTQDVLYVTLDGEVRRATGLLGKRGVLVGKMSTREPSMMRWSAKHDRVAVASWQKGVEFFSLQEPPVHFTPEKVHETGAHRVIFAPDGERAASAGLDRVVNLWVWKAKGEPKLSKSFGPFESDINVLAYDSSSDFLAVGFKDHKVRLWRKGKQVAVYGVQDSIQYLWFEDKTRRLKALTSRGQMLSWSVVKEMESARQVTNYRVCKKTLEAVALEPFAQSSKSTTSSLTFPWAPEELCQKP